ncbi:hypothetical protein AVEN_143885-1 [Araneus ventricosus]|uniref:Uncharacterized protein n=1 Tax=Araneus ventricosus TaxID=182803 RepID=A0A4Y2B5T7_ARAVE|nr:hypothetical protein AVEN_143885-1 [Araneus ventricosus]
MSLLYNVCLMAGNSIGCQPVDKTDPLSGRAAPIEPIIIFTFDAALSVNIFPASLKRLSAACLDYSLREITLITSNSLYRICLAIALAPDLKRGTAVRKNEWNKPPTLPYPDWYADPQGKSSPFPV